MFLAALRARPSVWLALICFGRFGTMLIRMSYAASIPTLMGPWDMSATAAGTVQTAFNAANAVALPLASWLADHFSARRILLASAWLGAAAALGFALFARSHDSAVPLFALVGLSQAGTYTPAIMLIAGRYEVARRGAAIGWLLASSSLGYVGSLAVSGTALATAGYQAAFLSCAVGPALGAILFTLSAFCGGATTAMPAALSPPAAPRDDVPRRRDRSVVLLNIGYIGHSWELLGMFAWAPAFVTAAAAATAMSGAAASIAGACSFAFGWTIGLPLAVIALFAAVYGFSAFGDSPVLSTAMTEAVAPGRLGRALTVRSVLGFGAGAVAPLAFGSVLDLTNPPGMPPTRWGWAFVLLGIGGVVAALCAWFLPKESQGTPR